MTLNEHLAKAMGWVEYQPNIGPGEYCIPDEKTKGLTGKVVMRVSDWNPSENIEQALMCLDTFDEFRIDYHRKMYEVILPAQLYIGAGVDKSLPMAISLACAKATGWTDETPAFVRLPTTTIQGEK